MLLLWDDLAENLGNPIGGNVTSNVTGSDVFYEEWMSFMSYSMSLSPSCSIFSSKRGTDQFMAFSAQKDQYCLRICTAETDDVSAALQCEHELDVMGCQVRPKLLLFSLFVFTD